MPELLTIPRNGGKELRVSLDEAKTQLEIERSRTSHRLADEVATKLQRPSRSPPSTDSSSTPWRLWAPALSQVVRGVSRSAGQRFQSGQF